MVGESNLGQFLARTSLRDEIKRFHAQVYLVLCLEPMSLLHQDGLRVTWTMSISCGWILLAMFEPLKHPISYLQDAIKIALWYFVKDRCHNIFHIHNNVLQDWQYSAEYFTIQTKYEEYFAELLSIPHNIVMDLNNVMVSKSIFLSLWQIEYFWFMMSMPLMFNLGSIPNFQF